VKFGSTGAEGGDVSQGGQIDVAELALLRRFRAECHPDAEAALLAGSRARAEGVTGSDHDVILLFRALPNGSEAPVPAVGAVKQFSL
jgi:hypothetical protein